MKQETIEEAAYQARRDYQNEVGKDGMNECIMFDAMKIQKGFELGAEWKQERMYSEEDVKNAFLEGWELRSGKLTFVKAKNKWFNEFKKNS